jgi:hypothetical protein
MVGHTGCHTGTIVSGWRTPSSKSLHSASVHFPSPRWSGTKYLPSRSLCLFLSSRFACLAARPASPSSSVSRRSRLTCQIDMAYL